jgi:hypothetical protein
MSSINSVSSSGNAVAAYQENLARLQAQKQTTKPSETKVPTQPAPAPTVDRDHDGDSR